MRASVEQVLGLDESGLVVVPECGGALRRLHPIALKSFIALRHRFADHGVQLAIASSYRSFDQQLAIWNEKMRGERAVLDDQLQVVDLSGASDVEKLLSILRWTALPGCSRHHWGSDLDVYDLSSLPNGYRLQLVPDEYSSSGPFARLAKLLDDWMTEGVCEGFVRPYVGGLDGVAFEPWHISHVLTADAHRQVLSADLVKNHLARVDIAGKKAILDNFEEIWRRFVV